MKFQTFGQCHHDCNFLIETLYIDDNENIFDGFKFITPVMFSTQLLNFLRPLQVVVIDGDQSPLMIMVADGGQVPVLGGPKWCIL